MRMSKFFARTLREAPSDAETLGYQLLIRAGFIRPIAAGIFSEMHLARRSLAKIEAIMRAAMNAIGGEELRMPIVHPAEIWQTTGRWYQIGDEMGRLKDRTGRDLVLAMTHEEIVATLAHKEIRSYRDLPRMVYHMQTKWRDDPRPRAGLIRAREFVMLDSYSLDSDPEGMEVQYKLHYQAYFDIFHRCSLSVISVNSDVGMMGGQQAHEYMYLNPIGEDTLIICDHCGHRTNRQIASSKKPVAAPEELISIEKIATPATSTIDDLAALLEIPKSKTAKAVFLMARVIENEETIDRLVFTVLRGDCELNETKLANGLGALELRPALEEEIRAAGAVPGFASPIGLENVYVVVDPLIESSPNLVAGANEEDFHFRNTNYPRDYKADQVFDITQTESGDGCPECGHALRAVRGIEVGNIFKLGTRYTDAVGCSYLDPAGKTQSVWMGSYGIGLGRLLACIAEEHQDQDGFIWPITVAPYQVHLVELRGAEDHASNIYNQLTSLGVEVLLDDRDERPGVKFKDADLIGIPLRLTISGRSIENGGVEFKARQNKKSWIVPLDQTPDQVQSLLDEWFDLIDRSVVKMPYDE
jgi:prolyl-tRNA synthetase